MWSNDDYIFDYNSTPLGGGGLSYGGLGRSNMLRSLFPAQTSLGYSYIGTRNVSLSSLYVSGGAAGAGSSSGGNGGSGGNRGRVMGEEDIMSDEDRSCRGGGKRTSSERGCSERREIGRRIKSCGSWSASSEMSGLSMSEEDGSWHGRGVGVVPPVGSPYVSMNSSCNRGNHHKQLRKCKRSNSTGAIDMNQEPVVFANCILVRPEGCRPGSVVLTATKLLFRYQDIPRSDDDDELASYHELNPKPIDLFSSFSYTRQSRPATRWGRQAMERHKLREYDASDYDCDSITDSSTSAESEDFFFEEDTDTDSSFIRQVQEQANKKLAELDDLGPDPKHDPTSNSDPESCCHTGQDSPIQTQHTEEEEERMYVTGDVDPDSQCRGLKLNLANITEIYPRTHHMQNIALELFISPAEIAPPHGSIPLTPLPTTSILIVLPSTPSRRNLFVNSLKKRTLNLNLSFWNASVSALNNPKLCDTPTPRHHSFFRPKPKDPFHKLTNAWRKNLITNYDYLLRLNAIAGRSFHDVSRYPVMPWVLSNYTSHSVPCLNDPTNFRDLTKPMGALDPTRLDKFRRKYSSLRQAYAADNTAIPPFMYGSHYSTSGGVVLHYLVRLRPFAGLHRKLQGGVFDVPDRLFYSVPRTWEICSRTSPTDVKELTPEWYSDPSFLVNHHDFDLGKRSLDGKPIHHVTLPPWADDCPKTFIKVMRDALESDICTSMLPDWIDLIFGYKQKGIEARKSFNIFYHFTYYNTDDLDEIEDDELRKEAESHIADFGHCPTQLFNKPHPRRKR